MKLENGEKEEKKSCCKDSSCCSADMSDKAPLTDNGSGYSPGGDKKILLTYKIRTFLFIVIMFSAVGIAGVSLLRTSSAEFEAERDDKLDPVQKHRKSNGSSFETLIGSSKGSPEKDFLFILFPGEKREETEKTVRVIEKTSDILLQRGIRVADVIIEKEHLSHNKLVSFYGIEGFPAVLAMGKNCGTDVVLQEITEEKLLASYLRVSKSVTCDPATCCPD